MRALFSIICKSGYVALALAALNAASPASFAADVDKSRTFFEAAKARYDAGELRAAQIELKNALKADPENVNARLLLADVYIRSRSGIAAQTEIEAARTAGADVDSTRVPMAAAYVYQRLWDKALSELDLAKIEDADQIEARRLRITALFGTNQVDEARQEAAEAVKLYPDAPSLSVEMARIDLRSREVDAALKTVDSALSLDPSNVEALMLKGDILRTTESLETALPFFTEAANLAPDNLNARLQRAATLVDLGRDEEASEDIAAVYAKAPESPLAHYLTAVTRARAGALEAAQELMTRTRGLLNNYLPATQFEGVLAYQLGNYAVAADKMERVIEVVPQSVIARRVLGATYLRQAEPKKAYDILTPLVDAGANDAALLALMGTAQAQRGNYSEAMGYFEDAVAKAPNRTTLRTQLAMSRIALGDASGASKDLEGVLDLDPNALNALVMTALIDLREGAYQDARKAAASLVNAYPDLALGYNLLGASYLGLEDLKKARDYFETSLSKDPDYHEARRNLAQLYRAQGNYREARRQYLRVLEGDRKSSETYLKLASLARAQGNVPEALDWLVQGSEAQPGDITPRIELISTYLSSGDKANAYRQAVNVDRDFPNNAIAIQMLAKTAAATGKFKEAIRAFDRWIEAAPTSVEAHGLKARTLWQNGKTDDARGVYKDALELGDDGKTSILADLIRLETSLGNSERALAYTNDLRALTPDTNTADIAAGAVYTASGQYDAALSSYQAAWETQPSRDVALRLASTHRALGQSDQAFDVLDAWKKQAPDDKQIDLIIANAHLEDGDYENALTGFKAILARDADNAVLLNNVAWLYQQKGDPQMLEMAERAYALDNTSPMIADTLGWILVKENIDIARGLTLIEGAAKQMPDNKELRFHLAYSYYVSGNTIAARGALDALLADGKPFALQAEAQNLMRQLSEGGGR